MLVMPVLTASLVEIGYVLRITRASVAEVMNSPYVRTAILKGLSSREVIFRHVLRNALMAPVTVIMLPRQLVDRRVGGCRVGLRLPRSGQLHFERCAL